MLKSARQPPASSAAESLVARIREAGGSLSLECATDQERTRLYAQIRAIRRFSKLPSGLQLLVEEQSWHKRVLTIAPVPTWMSADRFTRRGVEAV